ncbi:8491_t:CDS:2, partial [Gigaspora margarita]
EFGQSGQRQHAIEPSCTIAPLVSLYNNSGLLECKTKERQTKQHANSKLAKSCFLLYNSFFLELVKIQTHLEDFSLCEEYYNQLVISDFLKQILLDSNYTELSKNRQNKQKQTHIEHADIKNNTCEIGIQTDNKETSKIGIQAFDNMSHLLKKNLLLKKNEKFNTINQAIKNQKGTESQSKWCKKCNSTNINNKKYNCSNCNEKLNILATLRAEFANEFTSINTAFKSKPLVIKSHIFVQKQNSPNIDCISITQQLNSKYNIVISEMYVPNLLEFNSNSIENIKKVLENIQNITKINQEK